MECYVGITDSDGRIKDLLPETFVLTEGTIYEMHFDTMNYFKEMNVKSFYPYVKIVFTIEDPKSHYHIPCLLSPYGYTTYRGS